VDLAARYVVLASRKNAIEFPENELTLGEFLEQGSHRDHMLLVRAGALTMPRIMHQLGAVLKAPDEGGFEGGIYIRFNGVLSVEEQTHLRQMLNSSSNAQIILEENYDPFGTAQSWMKRVTFIHNQTEAHNSEMVCSRYQLIQDAASMGMRPTLSDVVAYHFEAGRLGTILNTTDKTEIISNPHADSIEKSGADIEERDRDYRMLGLTLQACDRQLGRMYPGSSFEWELLERTRNEVHDIGAVLKHASENPQASLKEVVEAFHNSYFRLRTAVHYTAWLAERLLPRSIEEMEKGISRVEGGSVLATRAGMTASRVVISLLSERVDRAISSPHYWETDFLVQNTFSHNPHYPETKLRLSDRLRTIPAEASAQQIGELVNDIVSESGRLPGGQLVCLDKSISPFFFTRIFDLQTFARRLVEKAAQLNSPLFLVVDNTLDFDTINAAALFPQGIPRNVFLIFTPSQAKLHQLGFDMTTGGIINLHANPEQSLDAQRLMQAFREKLQAEGGVQDTFSMRLLDLCFYQHHSAGSMLDYARYMLGKRHRNTRALVEQIAAGLGKHAEKTQDGVYRLSPGGGALNKLVLRDPKSSAASHSLEITMHFEPQSCMHVYLKVHEPPTESYIAGLLFDEIKRRIFKMAGADGIQLSDGTSWGFTISRMDWYMHTMRIAVGLEHTRTLARLGTIMASTLKELLLYPDTFLKQVEVMPLTRKTVEERSEELLSLDRLIPHDPAKPTPIDYYLREATGRSDYSFIVNNAGRMVAMVKAYTRDENGEKVVYISKAASSPEFKGQHYFHRMLEHIKDRAQADGIKRIILQTSASAKNEYVVKAYEKYGFHVYELSAEMLPNGWPLVMVNMEMRPNQQTGDGGHFAPLPDNVYEAAYKAVNLEAIRSYAGNSGKSFRLSRSSWLDR